MPSLEDEVSSMKEQLQTVVRELETTRAEVTQLRRRLGEADDGEHADNAVVQNPMKQFLNDGDDNVAAGIDAGSASKRMTMPSDATALHRFIKKSVARRAEAPLNLHQATAYFCVGKSDCPTRTKALFFAASFVLVLLQVTTVGAVFWSLMATGCRTNADCDKEDGALFCHPLAKSCTSCHEAYTTHPAVGDQPAVLKYDGHSHCGQPIGRYYPYANLTGIDQPDFACPFNDTICDACFDPATRSFHRHERDHIAEMDKLAWTTFCLTSVITAMSGVSELRDIKLCELSIRGKGELGWRTALYLITTIRQFAFLPVLLIMVPMVVEKRGGDPVSICMNTVAILFLLDVDNQCYSYGLPDHIRAEVEEHGRVVLDEVDVKFMSNTKAMYIFVLAVLMPWSVASIKGGDGIMSVSFYLGVAGIVEQAALRVGGTRERCLRACGVLARIPIMFLTFLIPLHLFILNDPTARQGARGCEIYPDERCADGGNCLYSEAGALHIYHPWAVRAPCNDGTNTLPENVQAVNTCG